MQILLCRRLRARHGCNGFTSEKFRNGNKRAHKSKVCKTIIKIHLGFTHHATVSSVLKMNSVTDDRIWFSHSTVTPYMPLTSCQRLAYSSSSNGNGWRARGLLKTSNSKLHNSRPPHKARYSSERVYKPKGIPVKSLLLCHPIKTLPACLSDVKRHACLNSPTLKFRQCTGVAEENS